jgi:hypothetical protein
MTARDVDMKRGVIFDRNGGEHKQEQTCPECASVFYDKNFSTCPVCKHGMAYVLEPFCPAGKKDCPCPRISEGAAKPAE